MDDLAELYQIGSGPITIMGNGPSLNDIPNSFLEKYPTFGCNKIFLREGFKPTYFAVCDGFVPGLWDRQYEAFRDIPKFCNSDIPLLSGRGSERYQENVYRFKIKHGAVWVDRTQYGPYYPLDPGIAYLGTVHAMLQLADWMGYDRFFLVGCDNTGDGQHFYDENMDAFGQGQKFALNPLGWEWCFERVQIGLMPKVVINLSTVNNIPCLTPADWRNF
jgi:hypothetical protein